MIFKIYDFQPGRIGFRTPVLKACSLRITIEESANDVAILFCGSKKSGKTSLVDRFINPTKDFFACAAMLDTTNVKVGFWPGLCQSSRKYHDFGRPSGVGVPLWSGGVTVEAII